MQALYTCVVKSSLSCNTTELKSSATFFGESIHAAGLKEIVNEKLRVARGAISEHALTIAGECATLRYLNLRVRVWSYIGNMWVPFDDMYLALAPKQFGNSTFLIDSIPVAEFQGHPLADHPAIKNGWPPGALTIPSELLDATIVAEAISVISSWYEGKPEWGERVGWLYGSVTEDVVTGYRLHNRGWRSIYCVTKRDAFCGTAPIILIDRLHQVLHWAIGSAEIFFSQNNALLAGPKQCSPSQTQDEVFTKNCIPQCWNLPIHLHLPCCLLFSSYTFYFLGQFIIQTLNVTFLVYILAITITLCLLAVLEVK